MANIICKNIMSESAPLIGELVANFIVGPHLLDTTSPDEIAASVGDDGADYTKDCNEAIAKLGTQAIILFPGTPSHSRTRALLHQPGARSPQPATRSCRRLASLERQSERSRTPIRSKK